MHSIARASGRTYIGGEFSRVGRRTGHGVQLAHGDGVLSPALGGFPEVSGGPVRAVASDGADGWYVGGGFTHVGGIARNRLAHVVPDGSGGLAVDPAWSPGADGAVRALAVDARGVVYAGGSFTRVGGVDIPRAAALSAGTGEPIAGWKPAPDAAVNAIAVRDITFPVTPPGGSATPTAMAVVFLGGEFLSFANNTDNPDRLGAVWGVGAVDQTGADRGGQVIQWNLTSFDRTVRSLVAAPPVDVPGTTPKSYVVVYAGGDPGASPALGSARFAVQTGGASPGTVDSAAVYSSWTPAVTCPGCITSVRALALSPSTQTLYAGGEFTTVGGTAPRKSLAAFATVTDATVATAGGSAATPKAWNPDVESGRVRGLALAGGNLYVGGDFKDFRTGADRAALAAFADAPGTADPAPLGWNPSASGGLAGAGAGVVQALAATASGVYAGGTFNSIGATRIDNLAAFDSSGNLDGSWKPNPDGAVRALSAANGRLYAGGDFAHMHGAERQRLAATGLADGSLDPNWKPAVQSGSAAQVLALSATDERVYVGGAFETLAGATRRNAGAVDPATGAAAAWNPAPNGNVYSLLVNCGSVYMGGGFTTAGGAARDRIAALGPVSGDATAWNPDSNSAVYSLAQDGGVIYAGGRFSLIGGSVRQRLAALDRSSGRATSWNPFVEGDAVRAVAAPGGEPVVYAGGSFSEVGNAARANLAAVDRASGNPTGWDPGTDDSDPATSDTVRALLAEGSALYAGGDFRQVGAPAVAQSGFATFGRDLATGSSAVTCGPPVSPPQPGEPAPPPPPPPPIVVSPPAPDTLPPLLGKVVAKPAKFRVVRGPNWRPVRVSRKRRARTSTKFRFTLSEKATVRFTFKKATPCPKRRGKPRRKKCVKWVTVGTREYRGRTGKNRKRFKGKVVGKRRWLRPGRYRAVVRATDAAGNRSSRVRAPFRVVRR